MAQAGKDASPAGGAVRYERHRLKTTLLYQLVDAHYPAFADRMAAHGTPLPAYVQREFEDYLKCGCLEHGFLRVRCEVCHTEHLVAFSCKRRGFCTSCGARRMSESAALLVDEVLPETPMRQWVLSFPFPLRFLLASQPAILAKVLGIVYRVLATHLIRKAGYTATSARTGAVTLIQRFGGALNLNVHFHMLFLDGVYVDDDTGSAARFRWVKVPTSAKLTQLSHTIAHRVSRFLERQGLLVRDDQSAYLSMDTESDDPMDSLIGHSITYRIATGPRPPAPGKATRGWRYKRYPPLMNRSPPGWVTLPASPCMPALQRKSTSATNSNACVATLPGPQYLKNAFHSPNTARSDTPSKPPGTAAPLT